MPKEIPLTIIVSDYSWIIFAGALILGLIVYFIIKQIMRLN